MLIIDYLLSYILLLIALHFMYLFYILSFTFNSINMYNTHIHNDSIIYNDTDTIIINSISRLQLNRSF